MKDQRERRAKLNIIVSLLGQFVTLVCGLIIPRLLIGQFGSEAYGATTSISQFLTYITLLEAGIGGVARSALYKPLADGDMRQISAVVCEIKRFFRVIGYIFAAYVLVLACTFQRIADVRCFDWLSTAALVVVISISTFAQYFIGVSYAVLLQASQRTYITTVISMAATVLNTVFIVFFATRGFSLIIVKLASSIVFALKPLAMWAYVGKHFQLVQVKERNPKLLEQKWNGLGQHLAFFLHSNTDIAVLTILANLATVAVYSVYHMVVTQIQNVTTSFSAGMEAIFGDMLAKKEMNLLRRTFSYYETLLSVISVILFSVTAVMIVPFIKLYTKGITDVNYIQPVFAILLVIASLLYCLRIPYHALTIAAGHFRQTQIAAYGEAIINITVSIVLVIRFGLVGVAVGTVSAVLFRFFYYIFYLSRNIFFRQIWVSVKRIGVNGLTFALIAIGCGCFVSRIHISTYVEWIACSVVVGFASVLIVLLSMYLFYREDLAPVLNKVFRRKSR